MTKRIRLAFGSLFFALMLIQIGVVTYADFFNIVLSSRRGWTAEWKDGRAIIITVNPQGPSTVLRVGDEIAAVQSDSPERTPMVSSQRWRVRAGSNYKLVIRRDGRVHEFSLKTEGPSLGQIILRIVMNLIRFLFLVTGVAVFLLKPADQQAWLLALLLSGIAGVLTGSVENLPLSFRRASAVSWAAALITFPVILKFFLIFPQRLPLLRRFPWLEKHVHWPFGLLILSTFGLESLARVFDLGAAGRLFLGQSWVGWTAKTAAIACMAGGLTFMGLNYRAANPAARRRLRVVVAGSGIGFFNLFLLPTGEFLGLINKFPTIWSWLDFALILTLPLIPLSFAYAIVRHQVIPVSLIIRRGIRYVLVSRGSVLLEILAVVVIVTSLLIYVFNRFQAPGVVIGGLSAVLGIVSWKLVSRLHDRYLAPVIDRRFFRQAYDSHQIIADLGESLRRTASLPQLIEEVATKIQSALQTESVAVLLRDEETGDYLSGYSCVYSAAGGQATTCQQKFRLPQHASAIARLSETLAPLEIDVESKGSNGFSYVESQALREMKTSLLLPLAGKEGMPGVISLGPRLGDLPYSREDKRLLMSVAGPTTFAIENARLVERMIEEARLRQELEAENEARAKELEEARQLQLSMLPKRVPQLPHLEIAAYMKPATEVGGDYYDFHLGDDGTLTIVVGDATGHGLKAGTVVTATKSLFNHLAKLPDIPAIFHQSSLALKQMNLRSLFMAVTMIKVTGTRIAFSSAGMPPILVYHAKENLVEEILIKGMPLGSMTNYSYTEHKLELAAGDLMVLMSDGFPERFNSRGEMLGYERGAEILKDCGSCRPQEIIETFVAIGDEWGEGKLQDDDVTFVVLRIR